VVRSFGSVAAVAAAALALMIGFLAFSAHSNSDQNRPPAGAQSGVPSGGRLVGSQAPPGPNQPGRNNDNFVKALNSAQRNNLEGLRHQFGATGANSSLSPPTDR